MASASPERRISETSTTSALVADNMARAPSSTSNSNPSTSIFRRSISRIPRSAQRSSKVHTSQDKVFSDLAFGLERRYWSENPTRLAMSSSFSSICSAAVPRSRLSAYLASFQWLARRAARRSNSAWSIGNGSTRSTSVSGNSALAACAKSPWFAPTSTTLRTRSSRSRSIQITNWLKSVRLCGASGQNLFGISGHPRKFGPRRTAAARRCVASLRRRDTTRPYATISASASKNVEANTVGESRQGLPGLLDLRWPSAVGQKKRHGIIEEVFHGVSSGRPREAGGIVWWAQEAYDQRPTTCNAVLDHHT